MAKPSKVNDEELIILTSKGKTQKELAEHFGVTTGTIGHRQKALGIAKRINRALHRKKVLQKLALSALSTVEDYKIEVTTALNIVVQVFKDTNAIREYVRNKLNDRNDLTADDLEMLYKANREVNLSLVSYTELKNNLLRIDEVEKFVRILGTVYYKQFTLDQKIAFNNDLRAANLSYLSPEQFSPPDNSHIGERAEAETAVVISESANAPNNHR